MKKKDPYRFAKICVAVLVFIFAAWLGRVFIFRGLDVYINKAMDYYAGGVDNMYVKVRRYDNNRTIIYRELSGADMEYFIENLHDIKVRRIDFYEYAPIRKAQQQVRYNGETSLADATAECDIIFRDDERDVITIRMTPGYRFGIRYTKREKLESGYVRIGTRNMSMVLKREISADDIISALP